MKRTLDPNSPLHFLPKEFGAEKLMILDSLRFTLEMLDHCSLQLTNSLTNISLGKEDKIHNKVFHYAWSIIDHGHRFCKLYKSLNPPNDSIINKLHYLVVFRDAIQHVDLNLKKTPVKMLDNGRPIYGVIKWVVDNPKTHETYTSLLISGIFNIKNIQFTQHSYEECTEFINAVRLETDTLKNKDPNEINLTKLISEISEVSKTLDQNLNQSILDNKLQKLDWKSMKDVRLVIKNGAKKLID